MRVILSRKGFDSQYGRVPSPILPDGRMISLPIPLKEAPTTFGAINRDGINLGSLTSDLTNGRITPHWRAHLDPDLDPGAVPRPDGWRPLFGQVDASLGHLKTSGVGVGDLFLFFGWFRPVDFVRGHWQFVRGSTSVHALWGWLSIGEVHDVSAVPASVRRWADGHPHLAGMPHRQNTLFVSGGALQLGSRRLPSAGVFTHAAHRVLTQEGASRSTWRLPAWMHPDQGIAELSYHHDRKRWSRIDDEHCGLTAVSKGQEFVLTCRDQKLLNEWLATIFQG